MKLLINKSKKDSKNIEYCHTTRRRLYHWHWAHCCEFVGTHKNRVVLRNQYTQRYADLYAHDNSHVGLVWHLCDLGGFGTGSRHETQERECYDRRKRCDSGFFVSAIRCQSAFRLFTTLFYTHRKNAKNLATDKNIA